MEDDKIKVTDAATEQVISIEDLAIFFPGQTFLEISFIGGIGAESLREGSYAFGELHHGWKYTEYCGQEKEGPVTAYVHHPGDNSFSDGVNVYYPPGTATTPGTTILHEFGHTVMYEMYDGFSKSKWWSDEDIPGMCPYKGMVFMNLRSKLIASLLSRPL